MYFKEEQKMPFAWIWLVVTATAYTVFSIGYYRQTVLGIPFGDEPTGDTELLIVGIFLTLFFLGLWFLFRAMSLTTIVDNGGIKIKFRPFHRSFKVFKFSDIEEAYVRSLRPVAEYGGHGFRKRKKFTRDLSYTIRGKKGLQLILKNGRKVLIGTQKPVELERVIRQYFPL